VSLFVFFLSLSLFRSRRSAVLQNDVNGPVRAIDISSPTPRYSTPAGGLHDGETGKRGEDRETARSFADQNKTCRCCCCYCCCCCRYYSSFSFSLPDADTRTLIRVVADRYHAEPNQRTNGGINENQQAGTLTTISSLSLLLVASLFLSFSRRFFFSSLWHTPTGLFSSSLAFASTNCARVYICVCVCVFCLCVCVCVCVCVACDAPAFSSLAVRRRRFDLVHRR